MKTLLSIDWDYFVPENPLLDLGHKEDDFYTNTLWEIRAVQSDIVEKINTSGEEVDFWRKIRDKFDISNALLYVTESHAKSYDIATCYGIDKVISFDAHCDVFYSSFEEFLENEEVNCENWLGMLFKHELIDSADIVLSKESLERGEDGVSNIFLEDLSPQKIDVIHICRSGAWTPPWLDDKFDEFVQNSCLIPKVNSVKKRVFNKDIIRNARERYLLMEEEIVDRKH